ncbi:hypothetical protein Tco_1407817 [Tanacetum coccineum]
MTIWLEDGLKKQDQSVKTASEKLVTPSESHSDDVWKFVTPSGSAVIKEALETLAWRRHKLKWLVGTLKKGSPFRQVGNKPPLRNYQLWKKTFYDETHKIGDMTELPKSLPQKTYEGDLKSEIVMVKIPRCMSWLGSNDAYDEPIGNLDKMEDEIRNPSPQSPHKFSHRLRKVPSFDEQEPQPNPLPSCPSLDVVFDKERLGSS